MRIILLIGALILMKLTAHSQGKDSLRTLSAEAIKNARCFTLEERREMLNRFSDARINDSLAKAREAEAQELAVMGIRMQHNIDLLSKLNNDLRQEIDLKNGQEVDCIKEKEIIIKSERADKRRKVLVAGACGAILIELLRAFVHF